MIKHAKPEHGSLAWLELRHRIDGRCVVGASEIPALLNQSPYKNRADLFVEKKSPVALREPTLAMRRGTYLEAGLLDFAADELGKPIITPDVMFQSGNIIATLDGQVSNEWGVEAKTTNHWTDGSPLPIEFILQAQAQMYAAEMERVTFTILDRNQRLCLIDLDRDDQMIDEIAGAALIFGDLIDSGSEYDENVIFTLPQIASLYPSPSGDIDLSSDVLDIMFEWQAVKEQMKLLEESERRIKDRLATMLGEHEYGTVNGERVISFKSQSQTRVDTTALKRQHPEIMDQFAKTSSFRVLRSMI